MPALPPPQEPRMSLLLQPRILYRSTDHVPSAISSVHARSASGLMPSAYPTRVTPGAVQSRFLLSPMHFHGC